VWGLEKSVQVMRNLDPTPMLHEDFLKSFLNLMHCFSVSPCFLGSV
jgi:hypothetical protein